MKNICKICGADDSEGGAFVPSTGGFICIKCLKRGEKNGEGY